MRAVIFDLDDTLYPHEQFVYGGFIAVARMVEARYGIAANRALAVLLNSRRHAPGREMQALCAAFDLSEGLIPVLVREYRGAQPVLTPFAGVESMLDELARDGWGLALLTNGLPYVQALKINALGLRRRIPHVIFAAEYARGGKPHPAPFIAAARRLGVPVERCVMVGDDPTCDIEGARRLGLRTIQVRVRGVAPDCGADAVLDSINDVPAAAAALVPEARSAA
jgi:HAD superfamily hydrolase (TIGR01509 family)